nr:MAG TPA: putative tail component [Bacteriophage sp.]
MKVSADAFANALVDALKGYTGEVEEALEDLKEETADQALRELKQSSQKDTGDYAKGWRKQETGNGWIIYNKTDYQLTHLLEKGHAKRGGGRVAPKVHIAPVEEKYVKAYENGAKKVIQK